MVCNRWISRSIFLSLLLLLPLGCSQTVQPSTATSHSQRIRVRLLADVDHVQIATSDKPTVSSDVGSSPIVVSFPRNTKIDVTYSQNAWHFGGSSLGSGVMTMRPGTEGSIRINDVAYRGYFRFRPNADGKFDVINDVDVEDYLKGVVTQEMFPKWHIEALKAQAVVARTYALYQSHTAGLNRSWDVYGDTRSQMYGGIPGETDKSRQAVDQTAGVVLTYGDQDGKIFEAYFSSCCGGVTQAAADAFPGDPFIPPLREQSTGACCNASPYYNWRPITIKKTELARRFLIWAQHRAKTEGRAVAELNMKGVYRIDVTGVNSLGRPSHVVVTDTAGVAFPMAAEDMRTAIDIDSTANPKLPSSYCKINGNPNSDSVTFYDGHGFGHGVGMCQYCAEARAVAGMSHQQILLTAFPEAKLLQAY